MGFGGFGGIIKAVTKVTNFFKNMNPLVSLGVTLFLAWVLRPKVPDIEDFGTNEFDDFERGLLLNKQSNDANFTIIFGESLVGVTRGIIETWWSDNTYLYMSIVMSEGEINEL